MRSPSRIQAAFRPVASTIARAMGALPLLAMLVLLAEPAVALAASPTPDPLGDPRSSGQGPGLVGDPATAILAVVAIALLTVAVTLLYVRATGRREGRPGA